MEEAQINFKRLRLSNPLIAAPLSIVAAMAIYCAIAFTWTIVSEAVSSREVPSAIASD